MSAYKAPLNEFYFLLEHLVDYDKHANLPGFEDVGMEMVEAILPEAAKFLKISSLQQIWKLINKAQN
ncbi:MAG: hypothetical protein CM15mP51_20900 [Porticoccaceae bacterium]|nr:MAG: hypothetical protein CM15mP51_20900 [Porticoccaceae bacterium]